MRYIISAVSLVAAIGLLSAGTAFAASTGGSSNTQDTAEKLERAEQLIKDGSPSEAVPVLQKVVESDADNADAYNYLGFAYRNLGEYDKSKKYYDRALEIDADHRGAREYLGELYLKLDKLPAARQQLARLDEICGYGCSEYEELKAAIDEYQQSQ